ncbi:MAG: M64 family metallopeptidase, partial [Acidobacteriota bacterium]
GIKKNKEKTTFFKLSDKWKNLVEPSTQLPTPWNKEEYDRINSGHGGSENESGGLSKDEKNSQLLNLVKTDTYAGKVGAFEGAAYRSIGLYRPELACTMFSTHTEEGFCRVCRQAIERVIDLYTGKNQK